MRQPFKALSTLAVGSIVCASFLTGPSATAAPSSESASAAAAACTASWGGSIRWGGGKIRAYATASNCASVKYTKVCATLWYHTVQASQPWRQVCDTLGKNQSIGISSPTANCVAGQMSVEVYVYNSSGTRSKSKWTRNVDTTSGCAPTGSNTAS